MTETRGGGRCVGRDIRRSAEYRGAGAGAGRAECGRSHGARWKESLGSQSYLRL